MAYGCVVGDRKYYTRTIIAMREAFTAYIASSDWRAVRREVLHRDGHVCTRCRSRERLTAHHTSYQFWGTASRDEISDCITLCGSCHMREHHPSRDTSYVPSWARVNNPPVTFSSEDEIEIEAIAVIRNRDWKLEE